MQTGIFCFRNDLRLHDNQALSAALDTCDKLHLVYAFEDRLWKGSSPNRISIHRARFLLESLQCLMKQINGLGGRLKIVHGNIEVSIPQFMHKHGAEICFLSKESAWEENKTEEALSKVVPTTLASNPTLIHPNDLPFALSELPETFTQFRKKVEKNWIVRPCLSPPESLNSDGTTHANLPTLLDLGFTKNSLDPRSCFTFHGGSSSGKKRVKNWLWDKQCLSSYKLTRNGMTGPDFSSRFSAWLATGSLSPREIYEEIKKYEIQYGANESTYWLIFELLWRDFFHFLARVHGSKIFQSRGIHPEREKRLEPDDAEDRFDKWKSGRTNNPFVNANMNELRITGWMSNRGRQNVASYLINNLELDWRRGAQWFEEQLIDYDPCSNYGNWLYLSGFGNDPQPGRYFNLEKQAATYDPQGKYTNTWS
jgi:deoxyribodipyrimidine photo-lyase